MMRLRISRSVWDELVVQLERRSARRVESGAFLLGTSAGDVRTVERCVYYDDLGENALHPTYVKVPSEAYSQLWKTCQSLGFRVVADVHTHPRGAVQSQTDRANPMIPEVGHVALILPHFARRPIPLEAIGFYEYLGSFEWRRSVGRDLNSCLKIDDEL